MRKIQWNAITVAVRNRINLGQADRLQAEVARNLGGTLGARVFGTVLSFGMQVVLARLLGVSAYGEYIYVLTWIRTLSLFGALGYSAASIRFVAHYLVRREGELLRGFLVVSLLCVLAFSTLLAVGLWGGIRYFAHIGLVTQHLYSIFLVSLPLVVIESLRQLQSGMLKGAGKVVWTLALELVFQPLVIIVAAYIVHYARTDLSTIGVFRIYLAVDVVTILIQCLLFVRILSKTVLQSSFQFRMKTWFDAALSMFVSSSAQFVMTRMDLLFVGSLLGTTAAGIYSVAIRAVRLVRYSMEVTNLATAPLYARLDRRTESADIQRVVFTVAKLNFVSTVAAATVLIFGAQFVVGLFGEAFYQSIPILQILMIGEIVNSLTGPNSLLMDMKGYHREVALVVAFALVIDFGLMWGVITIWGMIGAAIASAIIVAMRNIVFVVRVWQHLRINTTVFSKAAWRRSHYAPDFH